MKKIVLKVDDSTARGIHDEYDSWVERQREAFEGSGWGRQGTVVAEQLETDELATKVARLLDRWSDDERISAGAD